MVTHFSGVLHVILGRIVENLCISNVGAVQEAEEVDTSAEGDDAQILLKDKLLLIGSRICDLFMKLLVQNISTIVTR